MKKIILFINNKILNLLFMSILILLFSSCSKEEQTMLTKDEQGNTVSKSNARIAPTTKPYDSATYYLNIGSPVRDIIDYKMRNGSGSLISSLLLIGGGGWPPPVTTCSGITVTGTFVNNPPTGWCGTDVPPTYVPGMKDFWNNDIWFTAKYGTDQRQMYYIYYPSNKTANSPITVLIHGGGWVSGQDPTKVNGWNSTYTPSGTEMSNNIVKNLLAQGYVVIAPLYRLVQYGDNDADILANTISIQDQIDDIDACITHIKTNFPSCLDLNANSIQLLGESAGAHLALMYAYTKANTSYIKSVVSVAGPTNMNQMANWVKTPPFAFTCGNDFMLDNPNTTNYTHFPYYGIYDPNAVGADLIINSVVSPLTCDVGNIFKYIIPPFFPTTYPGMSASDNANKRVTNSYRLAQSCAKQLISNPLTNATLTSISPCQALNASRIVPTFIIHGTDDWLVPYTKATNTMDTKLSSTGGLIGTYYSNSSSSIPASSTYSTTANKHIIKLFNGANHNVANHTQTQPDILTWFNGHK